MWPSRPTLSLNPKYYAVAILFLAGLTLASLTTAGAIGRPSEPAKTPDAVSTNVDSARADVSDQNPAIDSTPSSSYRDATPAANSAANAAPTPTIAVSGGNPSSLQPAPSSLTSKKVGLQSGHWQADQLPNELASLRSALGAAGGGVTEVQFNMDIANRVAALLRAQGVDVDVLPATIPPGYRADAFVALHADGNSSDQRTGFKMARSVWSVIPQVDDRLLSSIQTAYAAATQLPTDSDITLNMTQYYAFNNHLLQHTISPKTPGVILEMGFLTSPADRQVLIGAPETVALAISQGILHFLGTAAGG